MKNPFKRKAKIVDQPAPAVEPQKDGTVVQGDEIHGSSSK